MRLFPLLAALLALGCQQNIHNTEAVRQGVLEHLSGRSDLNLSSMDVSVASISFKENEAEATVSFAPRGAAGGGMSMRYTLERRGGKWVVKDKASAGSVPHGTEPGPAQPQGESAPGSPQLPPGHPPVGAAKP
ncbi:MAG: hypothetical protein FJW37_02985 [Acidobacteria bacterium]|nr:hypothetical protein [Acidobacteriota bacterium]MBM4197961.1 hypothetical protein [Gammaproteobacteria bacterium]